MTIKYLHKTTFLILICILFYGLKPSKVFSQDSDFKRNTIYAGFANEGALYSINYDRIFSQNKKFAWSYRIGFSILEEAVVMPVGVYLLTGKGNSHAEFSFTVIPYIDKYQSMFKEDDLSDKYIYLVPGVGYRFQKPNGGLFFKVFGSPTVFLDPPSSNFWKMDPKLRFMVGGGLGFSF